MSRTADTDLPRRRKRSGERLIEVMELREYSPKRLLMELKVNNGQKDKNSEYGYYLEGLDRLSTLSRIRKGTLTLQNKHARMIAEILDIDVNYLLGTVDDFKATTYKEYLENIGFYRRDQEDTQDVIPEQTRIMNEYHKILSPYGVNVTGMSAIDDRIYDFDISYGESTITITAKEMEQFCQDIKDFVQISFKRLAMIHPGTDFEEGR